MNREPDWIEPFFEAFRLTGNVTAAARAAHISRETPQTYAYRHSAFRARWDALRQQTYHLYRGRKTAMDLLTDRTLTIPHRLYDTAHEAIDAAEQAGALNWEEAIVLRARYRVRDVVCNS